MEKPIHEGHRERVRQKYLKANGEDFFTHELLELLLFYALPRKDTNALAHALLDKFGSLSGLLEASPKEIASVDGISVNIGILLTLQRELNKRYIEEKTKSKDKLTSIDALKDYCINLLSHQTNECFYVICFDNRRNILTTQKIAEGTNFATAVPPKKILETVLLHKAVSVVFAHNHPGGSCRPSVEDIELTVKLVQMLTPIDVDIIDHIVVGAARDAFSFVENNLIQK